jgi:hypothetical protein
MKTFLLILVLGGILAAATLGAVAHFHGENISVHGWIALGLGTGLSILVGGGLMALSFHSARAGYDDRVQSHLDEDEE